jgi:hypothetical protein
MKHEGLNQKKIHVICRNNPPRERVIFPWVHFSEYDTRIRGLMKPTRVWFIQFAVAKITENNLFSSLLWLRENTKTSAPSLIVLVLKPFPSAEVQLKANWISCILMNVPKNVDSEKLYVLLLKSFPSIHTLSNGVFNFALRRITQGHAVPYFIWAHPTTIIYATIEHESNLRCESHTHPYTMLKIHFKSSLQHLLVLFN